MKKDLALGALALLVVCAGYGLVHERLFFQNLWTAEGAARFLGYTAVFWAIAGLILWLRPAWLAPAAGALVLLYSTWWCARFFDPLAPLAVVYFLGSAFFLGRRLARGADRAIALLIGLAIWIFLISIAVHFPVNHKLIYVIALGIPYGFARRQDFELRPVWPRAAAIPLYVVLAHWLVALKPEVSSDGLAIHLAIPTMVARHASFAFDFQQYTWALMPAGGDWAFTAAYLLGRRSRGAPAEFRAARADHRDGVPGIAKMGDAVRRRDRGGVVRLDASGPTGDRIIIRRKCLGRAAPRSRDHLARGELNWAGLLLGAAFSVKIGTSAYLAGCGWR